MREKVEYQTLELLKNVAAPSGFVRGAEICGPVVTINPVVSIKSMMFRWSASIENRSDDRLNKL